MKVSGEKSLFFCVLSVNIGRKDRVMMSSEKNRVGFIFIVVLVIRFYCLGMLGRCLCLCLKFLMCLCVVFSSMMILFSVVL